MRGHVGFEDDADADGHAIGLIHEDWKEGILALNLEGFMRTAYFTCGEIPEEDGDYEDGSDIGDDPNYAEVDDGFTGLGDVWGQDVDEEGNWCLWSYNDNGPNYQWIDGIYTV